MNNEPNPGAVVGHGFLERRPGVPAVGAEGVQKCLDPNPVPDDPSYFAGGKDCEWTAATMKRREIAVRSNAIVLVVSRSLLVPGAFYVQERKNNLSASPRT